MRAKRTLSESGLAYETPRGEELSERLASVMEVIYLIFNEEGYSAARGEDWLHVRSCAMKRFGSAACSPLSRRTSPKPAMVCLP